MKKDEFDFASFLFYIAGPYSASTKEGIDKNIAIARSYAVVLANLGIGFICPHLNSAHFGDYSTAPESFFYRLGFEIEKRCDAILIIPGWEKSKGTNWENDIATTNYMSKYFAKSIKDVRENIKSWILQQI